MTIITFCEFDDETKIGLFYGVVNKIIKPVRLKYDTAAVKVYEQEYPTAEIADKVFSKYVKAYKKGEYDNVFKKYHIDKKLLIEDINKLLHR